MAQSKKALLWLLNADNNINFLSDDLIDSYSGSISGSMFAVGLGTVEWANGLREIILANIQAAYLDLYAGAGTFSIETTPQGKFKITNASALHIRIDWSTMTADDLELIGAQGLTGNTLISGSGGTFTFPYQPRGIWTPHIHTSEDSKDRRKVWRAQSVTKTMRPSLKRHSENIYFRRLEWINVPAALVHQNLAVYSQRHADFAGITLGDTNASIENLYDAVMRQGGESYDISTSPVVAVFENVDDDNIDLNYPYLYHVDVDDDALNDIPDDALYEESGAESFEVKVTLTRALTLTLS